MRRLLFLFFLPSIISALVNLEPLLEWNQVDYDWPNETFKESLNEFTYIPENNLPFGIARWRDKLFITVPRWKHGVLSTLNYVDLDGNKSPPLKPYPSFEKNLVLKDSHASTPNFSKTDPPLVSVYRVFVDKCDRLWAIDNGIDGLFETGKLLVKRAVYIYDLQTDSLIRRYEFKDTDFAYNTLAANIIVDVDEDCENAFAYITDVSQFSLIVYDFNSNDSWKIDRIIYFYPNPNAGLFVGEDVSTHWIDGILSLSLGKRKADGFKTLYFHPLTSTDEFSVSTEVIRDRKITSDKNATFLFQKIGERGFNTQSTTTCYDEVTDVLFFSEINRHGVSCWKTTKTLTPNSVEMVAQGNLLNTPADIKIDEERNVWVISDRLITFLYRKHNMDEVNYKVFKFSADDLIKGSVCE